MSIMNDILPPELVGHIINHIKPSKGEIEDKSCWMLDTRGSFSVKTTWN